MFLKYLFFLVLYCYTERTQAYVFFQNSGPAVLGANVTFVATVKDEYYTGENLKYTFYHRDLQFHKEISSTEKAVNFTVEFNKNKYVPGEYVFKVLIKGINEDGLCCSTRGLDSCTVILTDLLNGHLRLIQNGIDRSDGLVIPNEPVSHNIKLSEEELQFLTNDKNTYLIYWYINCSLIASTGLSSNYTYENAYNTYNLEVLVEVNHDPLVSAIPQSATKHKSKLSSFRCGPIYSPGYTYGYYSATVRGGAADGSQRLPLVY